MAKTKKHKHHGHHPDGTEAHVPAEVTSNGATGPRPPMSRREFERAVKPLHVELVKLQLWAQHAGLRAVVVFEGRDAAGKGGAIKAITDRVSPRVFRIVALPAPSDREKSQMYIQRYLEHMPAAGEIVLFDRSWYNRAGVEHVMGFCTQAQYESFLEACPMMERAIVQNGIILIKYWFEVSATKQTERFQDRIADGRKVWKLSPMDIESHRRWYDYSRARDRMLAATDTDFAPWYVVDADDARRARLNCISHLLSKIPYKDVPREPIKLSGRQPRHGYIEPQWRRNVVPDVF
jgi:polyphosphate kinase